MNWIFRLRYKLTLAAEIILKIGQNSAQQAEVETKGDHFLPCIMIIDKARLTAAKYANERDMIPYGSGSDA